MKIVFSFNILGINFVKLSAESDKQCKNSSLSYILKEKIYFCPFIKST